MKYSLITTVLLSLLTLGIYQNCSPSHTGNQEVESPFDISSVYPYFDSKPEFMNNVQLTKAYKDGNVWRYQFVAGIVHADKPDSDVNVDIRIFDQDDNILCLSKKATVSSSSNHIMIDNCNASTKASLVKIHVYAKLATKASFDAQPTNTYVFSLSGF